MSNTPYTFDLLESFDANDFSSPVLNDWFVSGFVRFDRIWYLYLIWPTLKEIG